MAGGVGEGAIPLSIGYATISHQPQGDLFAEVLPAVMLGSLTAILLAGALNYVGKRYPHLTGEGRLQPGEQDDRVRGGGRRRPRRCDDDRRGRGDRGDALPGRRAGAEALRLSGAGGDAGPGRGAEARARGLAPLEHGAFHVYQFFSTAVTYPLLFAIGVAMTPWDKLVAAFNVPKLITIVSTVVTLMAPASWSAAG